MLWLCFVYIFFGVITCVPVEESGRRLRKPNPEETPGLIEGDIVPPPVQGSFRSAIKEKENLWPGGVVPFEFTNIKGRLLSEPEKENVSEAIDEFHKNTCVRFIPHTNERNFVVFRKASGCSSNIGMMKPSYNAGRGQPIMLSDQCFVRGRIMHEMMHALGFYHEQGRWDRDDYVIINEANIMQGSLSDFRKFNPSRVNYDLGAPYDYGSLMHYSSDAFTEYEGDESIVPIKPGVTIGQREGFSPIDIWKINKLYNCPDYRSVTLPPDAYTTPQKPVNVQPTPPSRTRTFLGCSFDYYTTCRMRDSLESKFDWEMKKGKSSSLKTGPDTDFSGKGLYMHINAVFRPPGDKAYFVTPFFDEGSYCFLFAYHMYGETIGTLRVFVRDFTGKEQTIFNESGDHGKKWNTFATTFTSDKSFEIYFEATVGGDPNTPYVLSKGNIAIDNVEVRSMTEYGILGCQFE